MTDPKQNALAHYEPTHVIHSQRYEPADLRGLCEYAKLVTESNLAPKHIKKWQDAMLVMKRGTELGFSTQMALENMFVIGGKTAMYADAAVSLVKGRGHKFDVVESTDKHAVVKTVRRGYEDTGETYSSGRPFEYTIAMAKSAGWTKNDMYQRIPRNMLLARAKMELTRMVYEDLLAGIYDPTEIIDMGSAEIVREVGHHYGDHDAVEAEFEEPEPKEEPALSEARSKQMILHVVKSVLGLEGDSAIAYALEVWNSEGLCEPVPRADLDRVLADLRAGDVVDAEFEAAPKNDPHEVLPLTDEERKKRYRRIFALLGETCRDDTDIARKCFIAENFGVASMNDLSDAQVEELVELLARKDEQEREAWVAQWAEIGIGRQSDKESEE